MLASTVPAVGRLDPKRANDSSSSAAAAAPAPAGQGSGDFTTAEELDALIGAGGAGEATGSSAKKGGKRRKA